MKNEMTKTPIVPGFCWMALVVAVILAWPGVEASALPYFQTYELPGGSDFMEPLIPADFFGPGSDPFDWTISSGYNTDTLVARLDDPAPPFPNNGIISIELVALHLVSTGPVTVTYNGGLDTEEWDVEVDLAPGGNNLGQLHVARSHDNGGTFGSILNVQPRFTFTKVGGPLDVRILDSVIEGFTGRLQTVGFVAPP